MLPSLASRGAASAVPPVPGARAAPRSATRGPSKAITELMLRWLPLNASAGLGGSAFVNSQFDFASFEKRLAGLTGTAGFGTTPKEITAAQQERGGLHRGVRDSFRHQLTASITRVLRVREIRDGVVRTLCQCQGRVQGLLWLGDVVGLYAC